jgi:hypothetical protein
MMIITSPRPGALFRGVRRIHINHVSAPGARDDVTTATFTSTLANRWGRWRQQRQQVYVAVHSWITCAVVHIVRGINLCSGTHRAWYILVQSYTSCVVYTCAVVHIVRGIYLCIAAREHLSLRLSVAHSAIDHPPLSHLLLLVQWYTSCVVYICVVGGGKSFRTGSVRCLCLDLSISLAGEFVRSHLNSFKLY